MAASEFLFVEEVAQLMRVPVSCVRYWIRTGKLQSLKPGRRVLVRRSALDQLLAYAEQQEAQRPRRTPARKPGSAQ